MTTNTEGRKRERIEARVSSDIKDAITRAAELQGVSVSDFVVQSAYQSAQAVIESQQAIRLSMRDSQKLIEALDNPSPPSQQLIRAAERHRAVFGQAE